MGKTTKGGRAMNPTDAARKQARKREIARNKMERDLQRATPKDVPEINRLLQELIDEEEAEKERGRPLSKQLHIRRKVLQDAMKLAVAKERARQTPKPWWHSIAHAKNRVQEVNMKRALNEGRAAAPHGHGAPMRRPEESVYYHPVTNPTGAPPPGRPQRYKDDVDLMDPSKADAPQAPRLTRTAHDVAEPSGAAAHDPDSAVLPPPDAPPPGILPPPDGPPPGFVAGGMLPPPGFPPPGMLPPPGLPPGMLAPPPGPPPGGLGHASAYGAAAAAGGAKVVEAVMEGAATAQRTLPAQQDPKLMAMVPATVRAKRPKAKPTARMPAALKRDTNAGFGLAPQTGPAHAADVPDGTFEDFMSEIAKL